MEVVAKVARVCESCQGRKRCQRCHGSGYVMLSTMGHDVPLAFERCNDCQEPVAKPRFVMSSASKLHTP